VPAKFLALSCLLLFQTPLRANTLPGDAAIDKHALAAAAANEATLARLAEYLVRPCKSDRDKARVIYRWITDRIAYNAEGFFSGDYGDATPAVVLRERKAVCEGYTMLYLDLSKRMGLKAVRVPGHAKTIAYVSGQPIGNREKHMWVAVWIDGRWQLVDPTWGAGHIDGQKFVKRFFDYYFLPPPDQLIFSHRPFESKWQLLKEPWSAGQFRRRPKVGYQLFELGVSSKAVQSVIDDRGFRELVQVYMHPSTATTIVKAPLKKHLPTDAEQEFVFRSEDYVEMALLNNKTFLPMKRDGKVFSRKVKAKTGTLHVGGRKSKAEPLFKFVVGYVVE
jgi:hypothetical protein